MTPQTRHAMQGVVMVEALVAMLIFAIGILATLSLQTVAIKAGSDAKYRADAAYLANQLIGLMWTAERSNSSDSNFITKYRYNCSNTSSGCAPASQPATSANSTCSAANSSSLEQPQAFKDWMSQYCSLLPGADLAGVMVSVVQIEPSSGASLQTAPTYMVAVTLYWQLPADKASNTWHQYVSAAQIS